jgi:probable phosphoglycerate mutase
MLHLSQKDYDHRPAIYCSPMKRTLETAKIIAAPHTINPQPRRELREISHGHWEGMRRDEVEASYSSEY